MFTACQVSVHSASNHSSLERFLGSPSNLSRRLCLRRSNLPRVTASAAALFLPVHATQKLYVEFLRTLERSRSLSSVCAQTRLLIKRFLTFPKFIVLLLRQSRSTYVAAQFKRRLKIPHKDAAHKSCQAVSSSC
jgi:hypothetical protein